jgi:hypothetical protein
MLVKLLGTLNQKEISESSSNDSAGKQLEVIPLDAYPPFNPLDWKSKVVTDVAKASVKNSTIPCTSFGNFASRFKDVLTQYGRNVQADWFLCLKYVFSISKHARWFDRWIAAGVDGKNHSWKKAKQTMKSSFDASAKSPLSWAESLKGLRQDETECCEDVFIFLLLSHVQDLYLNLSYLNHYITKAHITYSYIGNQHLL